MRPFAYLKPASLDAAFAALDAPGAQLLAGGTDVVAKLRSGHMRPELIVDLKDVAELRQGIVEREGALRIGAEVVMTDLMADSRVRRHFPALVESARVVGSVQIRNRATLVGNICNASPAADTAPALLVYGAIANVVARSGRRRIALNGFFAGPGKTALRPGEIVESLDLPLSTAPLGAAFERVTRRRGVDLATVNLCCLVSATGTTRFAYGAVGPRPFLVQDDSGALAGRNSTGSSRAAVLERFVAHASPISDVRGARDYRMAMLHVMSRRALETAQERLRHSLGDS